MTRKYQAECPVPVQRAVMVQTWENLVYLHWAYEPEQVQSLLPKGLLVDTFAGNAYVGLIPFQMRGIGVPHLPAVPYLGTFPEVNVRTYVIRNGIPGVWFFSLDINRMLPTFVARTTYSLPYCFGKVSHGVQQVGNTSVVETLVQRRWPHGVEASTELRVEVGNKIDVPSDFEHFLSARWGLYSQTLRKKIRYAPVSHEPWPLHRATALHIDDSLVHAAGLPAPTGEVHALFSPGVSVRVGLPSTKFVE
jgi:uncharacterized protein YqjF (DUF2071 family)